MSGHSKWSTIKHKKAATDAARGKLFSKLSKAITVAVKTGGGSDPEANHKLRMAIDSAKSANMPKANIDRAISNADKGGHLEEMVYEGFGPEGVAVMIDVATDNRNRTSQELKQILERGGGVLGGPGAVSHGFSSSGLLIIKPEGDVEDAMLKLIDLGVEDLEQGETGIEAYIAPSEVGVVKDRLEGAGFTVMSAELTQRPLNLVEIVDEGKAIKVLKLLETLEDHEDVQKVYANVDLPGEVAARIQSS